MAPISGEADRAGFRGGGRVMTVWGGKQWTGPGGGVSGRLPTLGHATLHPVRARAAGCRAGGCVAPSASGAAPAALGAGALDLPLVEVVILPRGRYERSSGGRLVLGLGLGLGSGLGLGLGLGWRFVVRDGVRVSHSLPVPTTTATTTAAPCSRQRRMRGASTAVRRGPTPGEG